MPRNTAAALTTEAQPQADDTPTSAAPLPAIPAEATTIVVDRWEDDGKIHARAFNRTKQDERDGEWGEDLGEYDPDALEAALRLGGFTPGDAIGYDIEGVSTITAWTR